MKQNHPRDITVRDSLLLLGRPQVRAGASGTVQDLDWQLPSAVLAYLALRPGWHSRDQLAELLRPDAGKTVARAYVRRLLHRLRQKFPSLQDLAIEEDRVAWLGGADVRDFDLALHQQEWERAVSLHRAQLLQGAGRSGSADLDDWFDEERLRLVQRTSGAMVALIQERQVQGEDCTAWFQRLYELDPASEDSIQFMLSLARTPGERHAAATAYQALHRRLADEAGQSPATGTVQAFLRSQAAPGPSATAPALSAKLPNPVSHLDLPEGLPDTEAPIPLGRERPLRELEALLRRPEVRLLTICGFGGVGKTVLARALHQRLDRNGSTPVAWVELAGADSAHGMLALIARGVGMQMQDGLIEDQLARWLGSRRLTLLLDNFEQLGGHVPVLQKLLARAAGLRIVLTSRDMLRIPEEHAFELSGLDCLGPDSAAARLFACRAQRLGVALDLKHASTIARLVEYLHGLPLGIELAAQWVLVMPADAILAELQANPVFIDAGEAGDAGARTIQSVFYAAWTRLTPDERQALVAVSTIRGPMDLDAAQKVSQAQPGVFLRLASRSLLRRMPDENLVIHPLVRELALHNGSPEQLHDANERHCHHFLATLAQPPALRFGQYMPARMASLLPKAEDIVRAWQWAADHGQWDLAAAAMPNLAGFTVMGSRFEEAGELARYALERIDPKHPLAGHLFAMQALSAFRLGRIAEAAGAADAAMRYDPQGPARSALHLVFARLHRFTEAGPQHALRALQAVAPGDEDMRMWVYDELGFGYWSIDEPAEAERWVQANLELSRRQNALFYEARALAQLGFVRERQGRAAESIPLLESALTTFIRMGDLYQCALCQRMLSHAHGACGDIARQRDAAQASFDTFQAGGYEWELADAHIVLARAFQAVGQATDALRHSRAALTQALAVQQTRQALLAIAAFGWLIAGQSLERGLALLAFVGSRADLRRPDAKWIRSRLADLDGSPELRAQAAAQAEQSTFERMCGIVLATPAWPGGDSDTAVAIRTLNRRG